jgi:hypothetical protein
MAMAAAVATGLYFVVQTVLILLLVVSIDVGSAGLFLAMLPIGMLSGAVSTAAFIAPFAFVAGVLAWRVVPSRYRYAGALGGLVAPLLVYLLAAVIGILSGRRHRRARRRPPQPVARLGRRDRRRRLRGDVLDHATGRYSLGGTLRARSVWGQLTDRISRASSVI